MKSMTFAVTIVGLMTFAQSAHAREHHYHHGHRHHIVASRGMSAAQRSGWSADSVSVWGSAPTSGIFAFAAAGNPSLETRTAYRGRDRGRPEAWCGWEMRHLVGADPGPSFNLCATGHIGVGLEQRELELLSFGRTTSEKSWVGKTANGSSNPATTAMRFARGRVQSPVRLP